MKFVHAADLHLDSALTGLDRYDGAPVDAIRGATREAMKRLIDLCLEERADFLLLVGDLFDGDWRDYKSGLFFAAQMSRLRAAGVPVIAVRGNHDAESRITRALELPDNVRMLATDAPESDLATLAHLGVALHGQGFAGRAVTDDLAARYPQAVPGLFNLGLLHTALAGREGHAPYAPCTVEELTQRGYDYWALGHVHAREEVCRAPWIVFPGNLQGRHARECGEKGATLVTVDDGRVARVEHRALDVVRWARVAVDLEGAAGAEEAVDRARQAIARAAAEADGRPLAARVVFGGRTAAHARLVADPEKWAAEVRAAATDLGGDGVWVEKVALGSSSAIDLPSLRGRDDAVGEIARALERLRADDAALGELAEELAEVRHKLPPELREGPEGLRLEEPALWRAGLLDQVEQLVLTRLIEREGSA
jgi:DNA repair exonuclease SbcCD nuclease subunit